jgi:hypothetical protein
MARGGASGRLLLAVAVFVVAVLGLDLVRSSPVLQEEVARAVGPDAPAKLDPAPWRREIEAIEALLYEDAPAAFGDPERAARQALELAERMQAELPRRQAQAAFLRLVSFAREVDARGDVGFAAPDRMAPRLAWEEVRRELFVRAAWFRRAAPDLARARRPGPRRADVLMVQALREHAKRLDALVAEGRRELPRFGEQLVDAAEGSRAERELIADWYAFARECRARPRRRPELRRARTARRLRRPALPVADCHHAAPPRRGARGERGGPPAGRGRARPGRAAGRPRRARLRPRPRGRAARCLRGGAAAAHDLRRPQARSNSGSTYVPSSSIERMTASCGILYGFERQSSRSQPACW